MNKIVSRDEWLNALAAKVNDEGPQAVAVEGHGRYVLVSETEFHRLSERKPTFKEWLLNGPRLDGVEIERDRRPARDFNF
jgi:PHD/YefM family antitoxin component YafN of YafNO toxin-antitoxin module